MGRSSYKDADTFKSVKLNDRVIRKNYFTFKKK